MDNLQGGNVCVKTTTEGTAKAKTGRGKTKATRRTAKASNAPKTEQNTGNPCRCVRNDCRN